MNALQKINLGINRWLTEPEPNAAGRMSLFRIIYGLFYLWAIEPSAFFAGFSEYPVREWHPFITFEWMGYPNASLLQAMAFARVAALVLLIFGFRTRLATLVVLLSGIYLHGVYYSFTAKIDHGDTYLAVYIPMLMLFSKWDSNYSIDAYLRQHKAGVNPKDNRWIYIWPMRIIIALLALMFFGSGYIKLREGHWMTDMEHLAKILVSHNVTAIAGLRQPNPLNPIIAQIPPVSILLQMVAITFELLFPLALVNRHLRTLFVAGEAVFHAFNNIFLNVNAYMLLITSLLIVDWQALYEKWWPFKAHPALKRLPTPVILAGVLGISLGTAVVWQETNLLRPPGAWLNHNSIFYFAAFFAGVAILRSGYHIARDMFTWIRGRRFTFRTSDVVEQH